MEPTEEDPKTTTYTGKDSASGLTVEIANSVLGNSDDASAIQVQALSATFSLRAFSMLDAASDTIPETLAIEIPEVDFLKADDSMHTLFGTDHNDVLVIDRTDILVEGGLGVDIAITADASLSLAEMLRQGEEGIDPEASPRCAMWRF